MFLVAAAYYFVSSGTAFQVASRVVDPQHVPVAGEYAGTGGDEATWTVRGSGFSLDLSKRVLKGQGTAGTQQEKYRGIGLLIDGAKDVTVKNLHVSGFKQNIVLRNCTNVKILNCQASHSGAIRMGTDGKPIDTFLDLRNIGAWRTYGAGIWMEKCQTCQIEKCTASDAQNGILLVDSSNCTVRENDCSFNGGWGVGLWKSSFNELSWNHADFCNRPWAGGWGGDAAGIVVVNDCKKNHIAANSMTHGGDGFFLSDASNGGLDKETGKYYIQGGSPENTIAFCDGSWASNNAFEGTFSIGNAYYKNTADDSNYGFWLGFSSYSYLFGNEISGNKSDGVAIGQGRNNILYRNTIERNGNIGVHAWSEAGIVETDQPSTSNMILSNRIADSRLAISVERSTSPVFQSNTIERAATPDGFRQPPLDFAVSQRLNSWAMNRDARAVLAADSIRPANWHFYRETSGPKGPEALKIGDYAPRRP